MEQSSSQMAGENVCADVTPVRYTCLLHICNSFETKTFSVFEKDTSYCLCNASSGV
jgi:hypothetical protein